MERGSKSPAKAESTNRGRASSPTPSAEVPRTKAKAPLVLEGADYAYIETATYIERKGVGIVYDWEHHHKTNAEIAAMRNALKAAREVEEAAAADLQTKEENQAAYSKWLEMKKRKKQERHMKNQHQIANFFAHLRPGPSSSTVKRESDWNGYFARQDLITRETVTPRPGTITNVFTKTL